MMQRREFLAATGALGIFGNAAHAQTHQGHSTPKAPPKDKKIERVVKTLTECLDTGEACLSHCLRSFREGDHSLAKCASAVKDLLSICAATREICMQNFASREKQVALIRQCSQFCEDCARECEPHINHHKECKACYDACKECIKACQAVA